MTCSSKSSYVQMLTSIAPLWALDRLFCVRFCFSGCTGDQHFFFPHLDRKKFAVRAKKFVKKIKCQNF